ncbi:MAG: HEAT repeat domain-containing protein [Gammaproteobacteria bacterium]|nr:HEAT repeat domain-containing protein [Gammaproteobacteria bacterium]
MRAAVALAIMLLILLLCGLMVYVVVRRYLSDLSISYEGRRRAVLVAAAETWLDSDPERVPPALEHLGSRIDRRLFVEVCLALLPDGDARARARITEWLRRNGVVDDWTRQLGNRSSWKRGRAAEALGVLRDPDTAPALVNALNDKIFDVRMRAAKALGALGGDQARQALIRALTDDSRWSVIRISDILADMGTGVLLEILAAFPAMGRGSRLATLDLVARLGTPEQTPFLVNCLNDEDRDIRARAAAGIGRLKAADAVAELVASLADPEWPVRAMAAKSLGDLAAISAIPQLTKALEDREWWVRSNAADALRKLGTPGLDALVALLGDPDRFARDQALSMLESSGELDRRLAALASSDSAERSTAEGLVRSLASRQSADRLRDIRDRQQDATVRTAIDQLITAEPATDEAAT